MLYIRSVDFYIMATFCPLAFISPFTSNLLTLVPLFSVSMYLTYFLFCFVLPKRPVDNFTLRLQCFLSRRYNPTKSFFHFGLCVHLFVYIAQVVSCIALVIPSLSH